MPPKRAKKDEAATLQQEKKKTTQKRTKVIEQAPLSCDSSHDDDGLDMDAQGNITTKSTINCDTKSAAKSAPKKRRKTATKFEAKDYIEDSEQLLKVIQM